MTRSKDINLILKENADNFAKIIDSSAGTIVYIGATTVGSVAGTTSTIWQIKRILVDGGTVSIGYATGDDSFNQTWNSRGTLSYS